MDIPYEYTHMGRPIRVWDKILIWGRTNTKESRAFVWLLDLIQRTQNEMQKAAVNS